MNDLDRLKNHDRLQSLAHSRYAEVALTAGDHNVLTAKPSASGGVRLRRCGKQLILNADELARLLDVLANLSPKP